MQKTYCLSWRPLLSMRVQLLAVYAGSSVVAVSCPKGWHPNGGSLTRCFRSFTFADTGSRERGTWNDAFKFCATSAAPLATLHEPGELQLVSSLLSQPDGPCWIGLRRRLERGHPGELLWIDDPENPAGDTSVVFGREGRISSSVDRCGAADDDG